MERADQILVRVEINACFSTDAAVHLGEQGGWNLDKRNSAQIGGGGKAAEIAHDPAPEGYQHITPVKALQNQPFIELLDSRQIFMRLSRRKNIRNHAAAAG